MQKKPKTLVPSSGERLSDFEKAKEIVRALIQESGGEFCGKTRLFKAFYAAHLFHFQNHKGILSAHPIVHMPRGPAIDKADALLGELEESGAIESATRMNGPYTEQLYRLRPGSSPKLSKEEMESIREAVAWIGNKSATELSAITHENSRSWTETHDGQEMNIYMDLLGEVEYAHMKKRQESISGKVHAVFGKANFR